jgi:hypothetical protein
MRKKPEVHLQAFLYTKLTLHKHLTYRQYCLALRQASLFIGIL